MPSQHPDTRSVSQPADSFKPHHSGHFFKLPDNIDFLMGMSDSQLRAYIVAMHAIQRDRNAGMLSIRQAAKRARRSPQHTQKALVDLCGSGELVRTERTGIRGTVVYECPIKWRAAGDCTPVGTQSQDDCTPVGIQSNPGCAPVGVQNCAPVGVQHLESLELKTNVTDDVSQSWIGQEQIEMGVKALCGVKAKTFGKAVVPTQPSFMEKVLKNFDSMDAFNLWLTDRASRLRPDKPEGYGLYLHSASTSGAEYSAMAREAEAKRNAPCTLCRSTGVYLTQTEECIGEWKTGDRYTVIHGYACSCAEGKVATEDQIRGRIDRNVKAGLDRGEYGLIAEHDFHVLRYPPGRQETANWQEAYAS